MNTASHTKGLLITPDGRRGHACNSAYACRDAGGCCVGGWQRQLCSLLKFGVLEFFVSYRIAGNFRGLINSFSRKLISA